MIKVSAHSPKTLDDAYGLTINFEREINNMLERNKNHLEKRSLESNHLANQSSKFAKFSKTSKPSHLQSSMKGTKL